MTKMDTSEEEQPTKRELAVFALAYAYAQDILAEYNARANARFKGNATACMLIEEAASLHEDLLRDLYGFRLRFDRCGRVELPRALPSQGLRLLLGEATDFARLMIEDLLQGQEEAWPDGERAVAEVIEVARRLAISNRPDDALLSKVGGRTSSLERIVIYRTETGECFGEDGKRLKLPGG